MTQSEEKEKSAAKPAPKTADKKTGKTQEKSATKPAVPQGVTGDLFLGDVLRHAREEKKLTLDQVAQKLRIKEIYLKALEEGNYHLFPGLIYGVGFLRTYAVFLGVPPQPLIDRFKIETSELKKLIKTRPIRPEKSQRPSFKILARAALLVVVFYLAFYLFWSVLRPAPQATSWERDVRAEAERQMFPENVSQGDAPSQSGGETRSEPRFKTHGLSEPARLSFIAVQKTKIVIFKGETVVLETVLNPGDQYNPPKASADLTLKAEMPEALTLWLDGRSLGVLKNTRGGLVSLNPDGIRRD